MIDIVIMCSVCIVVIVIGSARSRLPLHIMRGVWEQVKVSRPYQLGIRHTLFTFQIDMHKSLTRKVCHYLTARVKGCRERLVQDYLCAMNSRIMHKPGVIRS